MIISAQDGFKRYFDNAVTASQYSNAMTLILPVTPFVTENTKRQTRIAFAYCAVGLRSIPVR